MADGIGRLVDAADDLWVTEPEVPDLKAIVERVIGTLRDDPDLMADVFGLEPSYTIGKDGIVLGPEAFKRFKDAGHFDGKEYFVRYSTEQVKKGG